jgi:hypothetical protein
MRPRLTSVSGVGTASALLAVLGLLAPPLPHRHAPGESAIPLVEALGCDRSLADVHLHAATEHPRPPCPACALGPTSPALVTSPVQPPAAAPRGVEVLPAAPLPTPRELPAHAARGPPVLLAA